MAMSVDAVNFIQSSNNPGTREHVRNTQGIVQEMALDKWCQHLWDLSQWKLDIDGKLAE